MRWKRRRFLLRIWRNRRQITSVINRTGDIGPSDIILFATMRNEMVRLPHFLDHYRALGAKHFLIVDNGSDDGTAAYLRDQPDISLWTTDHSYKLARFGMDWLGWLQWQHGAGHWCLTVDADELLTFPHDETRDLQELTTWLDQRDIPAFGAIMLEMYPKGPLGQDSEADPIKALPWFDAHNYRHRTHPVYQNRWIQGGVRERVFFADDPDKSPTLSKTPLVKWHWRHVYVSSTHQMLPLRLNHVFDHPDRPTGALLHTKFLPVIRAKSAEEIGRRQHFENSDLYINYHQQLAEGPDLWSPDSTRYEGWEQLVSLGLMSKGDWV
ncbi:glycosyltransferase family 2 protein [Loktanella agnita]|uniref:glycosyltransferase family 2 protein n=1 Tax=Loktanella agnita TaxID=287097 RepID=UPI0039869292